MKDNDIKICYEKGDSISYFNSSNKSTKRNSNELELNDDFIDKIKSKDHIQDKIQIAKSILEFRISRIIILLMKSNYLFKFYEVNDIIHNITNSDIEYNTDIIFLNIMSKCFSISDQQLMNNIYTKVYDAISEYINIVFK